MISILFLSQVLLSRWGVVEGQWNEPKWSHDLTLSIGFTLKWTTDDPIWITMEMSGPTRGYVAIGFSPSGGMRGSDFVMGWVDEDGKGNIKDLYGIANQSPLEDPVKNYELLIATAVGSRTTITFRRKWNTCDVEHDFVITDDTIRILWAYNHQQPYTVGGGKLKYPYHWENRGVRRAYIRSPPQDANSPPPSENVKHWDVRMENNSVNAEDDVYFCTIAKLVNLEKKHHMIGFEPLLDESNKHNIHHMFLYECIVPAYDGGTMKLFDQHVNTGGRCYTPNMPPIWSKYCINIPILWTSGSEGNLFPKNVGFPLGEEHGGATYFMFEIHYNNPQRKTFTDNSGIRMLYTDQLRENDGGVLAVGHKVSPFQTVPPSMSSFTAMGYCVSECTRQVIPPEGINVISVLLHAHQAGRKLELKHLRNGVELEPLGKENNYDFNYQQTRVLRKEVKIYPGDEMISVCQYDTTRRTTPAFGGLGTRDEMCMSFVYYYPRIPLADCKSQPEFYSFLKGLGIRRVDGKILQELNMPYVPSADQEQEYGDNRYYLKNSTYDNPLIAFDALNIVEGDNELSPYATVGEAIRKMDWKGSKGKSVEEKWLRGNHYAFCTAPNNKRRALKDYVVELPKYKSRIEPIVNDCLGDPRHF